MNLKIFLKRWGMSLSEKCWARKKIGEAFFRVEGERSLTHVPEHL